MTFLVKTRFQLLKAVSQYFYQMFNERMHGLKVFIILVLMQFVAFKSFALDEARLLKQSKSGQTALFNLGIHDGVAEGDYAVIAKEIRSLESQDLRVVPVARAKNVKINPDSSVWILFKIHQPELLVEGDKFLILSESTLLKGRRDPRIGKMVVVARDKEETGDVLDSLGDDDERLAKKKDKYKVIAPLHERELRSDNDFDLLDVEKWDKKKDVQTRTALYKSPHQAEFRKELKLATFEKMVTAYLKQVNNPNFNYDAFYEQQMRASYANEFNNHSSFGTEYNDYIHDKKERSLSETKLQRTILEKGENWSEDFSDEELRGTLRAVSVLQEKDRRDFIIANPNRYLLSVSYGMSLTDGQTKQDSTYRRDNRYAIEVNFEGTPFLKHQILERFTLNASFRSNKSAFADNKTNMDLNENSISVGANWYPVYAPYTINAPVIFLGTFLRSGYGTVEAPTAQEKGNYTVTSIPGFLAGMRYNFKNNFGLRIVGSIETLDLSRYESNKTGSILPEDKKLVEGKFGAGLGYSF
jgi:hypothetical protein